LLLFGSTLSISAIALFAAITTLQRRAYSQFANDC
jgi:hypothetical protein